MPLIDACGHRHVLVVTQRGNKNYCKIPYQNPVSIAQVSKTHIMTATATATAAEKALTMLDRESRVTLSQRDFAAFSKALDGW